MMILKTAVVILAALAVSAFAEEPSPNQKIPYKQTEQGELKVHVFNPADHSSGDRRPTIIFFFGGGWNGGSPKQFYGQSLHLASRGMVAICAEYRIKKNHGTDPRACVMDAKSAMRWVRTHAGELGIDPERIVAGGGSAGGHLAATTATVTKFNEPDEDAAIDCRPKALVLFNPVFDNGPEGYGHDRVKEYWQDFSPIHNLKKGTPPTLVFLGTKDKYIPVATAEKYRDLMKANGDRCDLHLYQDRPHSFFNYKGGKNPDYDDTLQKADDFLVSLGFLPPLKEGTSSKQEKVE
jgi:acetyl esterase/lipase